jgi:hypothetical protein
MRKFYFLILFICKPRITMSSSKQPRIRSNSSDFYSGEARLKLGWDANYPFVFVVLFGPRNQRTDRPSNYVTENSCRTVCDSFRTKNTSFDPIEFTFLITSINKTQLSLEQILYESYANIRIVLSSKITCI